MQSYRFGYGELAERVLDGEGESVIAGSRNSEVLADDLTSSAIGGWRSVDANGEGIESAGREVGESDDERSVGERLRR